MKKVFNNDEVAHIWAKQSQSEGRNAQRTLFFDGDKIYSYGRHFCIARLLPDGRVLFTERTYSNTTAKHIDLVRYAVNHKELIYCANPDEGLGSNIPHFTSQFKQCIAIIEAPKKRQATKEAARASLLHVVDEVDKYLAAMERRIESVNDSDFLLYYNTAKSQDIESLRNQLAILEAEKQERLRLAKIEAEKKAKKSIAAWKKGKDVRISHLIDTVYLRKYFDTDSDLPIVQTSMGARVSLKQAKILFDMINSGKDIKGHEIDGYTVIGLNGVLTIGCHKIERKEINLFTKLMGWGEIPLH